MNEHKIPFNTLVEYNNGVIQGQGRVVGMSTVEQPILGSGYIVKDVTGHLPNETYPYDTFVVFDIHLKSLKEI